MVLSVEVSHPVEERLTLKARAAGMDVPTYVARLVERDANRPSLLEISGDSFEKFKQSGLSDEALAELLEQEEHQEREHKRGKPLSE